MAKAAERLRELRALLESSDPIPLLDTLKTPQDDLIGMAQSDQDRIKVLNLTGFHAHTNGKFGEAYERFSQAFELNRDLRSLANALIAARKGKDAVPASRRAELLASAHETGKAEPDSEAKAELYDVLTHNCGAWDIDELIAPFGAESLRIKDALQKPSFDLAARDRPIFDFDRKNANVISFSLFGTKPRYLKVAIENARACPNVFPGWTCRFYVDKSVPTETLQQLAAAGSQIHIIPKMHDPKSGSGLFWRFLVASDPNVDFFMVRDADSLISVREKCAVDEWVESDCDFHVLRDFYSHSELMLAGLWGGVGGRIADIAELINTYTKSKKPNRLGVHNHDQLFLRGVIWPSVKMSLMQHDSVFGSQLKFPNVRNFPNVGRLHPKRHVGQNMGIFMKNGGES
ncbi:hypothetical protein ACFQ14_16115 [Pseudahrensia aquimaris]|uniref:Tetratricopeptide repeat protein n=1 Tax=Pseudahrensia aquimaris TaxID=744461 RepID=A0ABW3FHH9_9HYPH